MVFRMIDGGNAVWRFLWGCLQAFLTFIGESQKNSKYRPIIYRITETTKKDWYNTADVYCLETP